MAFAKVFELTGGCQLLMTKETDRDKSDEKYQIAFRISTEEEGVTNSVTVGYRSVEIRNRVFNSFDLETAQELYQNVLQKIMGK